MVSRGRIGGVTPPRIVALLNDAVAKSSQAAVAEASGLTRQTVQRYMKGIGEPSSKVLTRLADYFGVPVGWLRGGDPTMDRFTYEEAKEYQAWLLMSENEREELLLLKQKKRLDEIDELFNNGKLLELEMFEMKQRLMETEANFDKYKDLIMEFRKLPISEMGAAIETLMIVKELSSEDGE